MDRDGSVSFAESDADEAANNVVDVVGDDREGGPVGAGNTRLVILFDAPGEQHTVYGHFGLRTL